MSRAVFSFSRRRLDCDTSLIAFEGYLDLGAAPELKWVLVEEFGAGPRRLVLDLSRVTFMDSTALGVLVGIQRNLSQGAVLAIAAASPAVLRLFELTGVDRTFDLFATVGAAVASLQPKPPDFVDASGEDAMPAAEPVRPRVKSLGDEPASSSDEDAEVRISLTGDAAVALGLARTAMPFSRSKRGQAERWLRILRQYGDAANLLASLGSVENPIERGSEHDLENGPGRQTDGDKVAIVARHARRIAEGRGATAVRTSDLLAGVIEVYGKAFERALAQHGINTAELTERLGLGQSGVPQR